MYRIYVHKVYMYVYLACIDTRSTGFVLEYNAELHNRPSDVRVASSATCELRVASCDLRVATCELRVGNCSCLLWWTGGNIWREVWTLVVEYLVVRSRQ